MKLKKKTYIKPDLEKHTIDQQISLQATSENTGPGDGFGTSQAPIAPPEEQNNLQSNPFDENNLE